MRFVLVWDYLVVPNQWSWLFCPNSLRTEIVANMLAALLDQIERVSWAPTSRCRSQMCEYQSIHAPICDSHVECPHNPWKYYVRRGRLWYLFCRSHGHNVRQSERVWLISERHRSTIGRHDEDQPSTDIHSEMFLGRLQFDRFDRELHKLFKFTKKTQNLIYSWFWQSERVFTIFMKDKATISVEKATIKIKYKVTKVWKKVQICITNAMSELSLDQHTL